MKEGRRHTRRKKEASGYYKGTPVVLLLLLLEEEEEEEEEEDVVEARGTWRRLPVKRRSVVLEGDGGLSGSTGAAAM